MLGHLVIRKPLIQPSCRSPARFIELRVTDKRKDAFSEEPLNLLEWSDHRRGWHID
jgi:hypothetical protein